MLTTNPNPSTSTSHYSSLPSPIPLLTSSQFQSRESSLTTIARQMNNSHQCSIFHDLQTFFCTPKQPRQTVSEPSYTSYKSVLQQSRNAESLIEMKGLEKSSSKIFSITSQEDSKESVIHRDFALSHHEGSVEENLGRQSQQSQSQEGEIPSEIMNRISKDFFTRPVGEISPEIKQAFTFSLGYFQKEHFNENDFFY